MGKRKPSPESFNRGFGQIGWVYVARNNMHRDDVFKVGYTEKTPEERMKSLNTEQRNRTSQIGFFSLHFACAVLDAQGCEQELFNRLGRLLEHEKKEFVNAPLEVIVGELLHIQKKDNQTVQATAICQQCGKTMLFCPLPQVLQPCKFCGKLFATNPDATPTWNFKAGLRRHTYKPKPVELRTKSALAKAFVRLQCAVKNYAYEGIWTDDEFLDEIADLLRVETPNDREIPESKPTTPPAPKQARKVSAKQPKSRKGWMDCPDCLSSIELIPGEHHKCVECGWKMPEDIVLHQERKRTSSALLNVYGRNALGTRR